MTFLKNIFLRRREREKMEGVVWRKYSYLLVHFHKCLTGSRNLNPGTPIWDWSVSTSVSTIRPNVCSCIMVSTNIHKYSIFSLALKSFRPTCSKASGSLKCSSLELLLVSTILIVKKARFQERYKNMLLKYITPWKNNYSIRC